jgi:hypothetical protein
VRRWRRLWLAGGAAVGCLLFVGSAAAVDGPDADTTTSHTMRVGDDIEAWYQVLPIGICSTPIGCPPPLPIPVPGPSTIYPEGTLHVGAVLGIEISRTYLKPALYKLPADATLTGGTATVPIDADLQAGTINAAAAAVKACLAAAPVIDGVQGALEDPPAINCNVSSKVTATSKGDALTVNLSPFIKAWRAGKPNYGFALVPDVAKLGVWQVALNGRAAAGPHIGYDLTYTQPAPVVAPTTEPPVEPPPQTVVEPPVLVPPMVVTTAPPAAPPVLAQPQPVAQVNAGFKYSAVFLVPLVFLLGLLFVGRTFTRDATPQGAVVAAKRRH